VKLSNMIKREWHHPCPGMDLGGWSVQAKRKRGGPYYTQQPLCEGRVQLKGEDSKNREWTKGEKDERGTK